MVKSHEVSQQNQIEDGQKKPKKILGQNNDKTPSHTFFCYLSLSKTLRPNNFATNSDFLIPISLLPNLRYFKLCIGLDQIR